MRTLLLALATAAATIGSASASELHVLAAGSLREVIGEIAGRYHTATGVAVTADFGPSGVLRERIEKGEKADLLTSADMGHPLKLLADGRATRVAMFTRNALCAFAMPKVGLTSANFAERLLDPAVKLGTSTPKADPAGDYTWLMFHRIDALRPGAYATLDGKAQKIVGGAGAATGDPVADGFKSGTIDVMIGYCSGRQRMAKAVPGLAAVEAPKEIAAGPEYGLAILKGADPHTADFALYMLSPEGQRIFAQFGFAPVGLPTPAP
ncbi:MAG TPA: extracellular solute-binding protein [Stellaceae bacterium]|nr:extracellular solute-binding protein [Stellaceae bacterium]